MTLKTKKLIVFLKKNNGIATFADIINAGFHKDTLSLLLKSDQIEKISRGLYRLKEGINLSNPDLITASIKIPKGVVCLISALSFHNITNEIPRYIELAIPRGTHPNKIDYPPIKLYSISEKMWKSGIEEHNIEGYKIRVYSLAKTIVDCFKFRNKIGIDVARNALKEAILKRNISSNEIIYFAKICRVKNIIFPYLESMI